MALVESLEQDILSAMKAGERDTLSVLRQLKSALKNAEIDKGGALSEDEVLEVFKREAKKLRDSRADFESAGRDDLVASVDAEIDIISSYLPPQMSEEEIRALVQRLLDDGLDLSNRGAAIGVVMKETAGKADGSLVSRVVADFSSA